MAMELKHLTTQMHDLSTKAVGVACDAIDEISRLRAENAELKQKLQDQCISCPVKMQEDDVVDELKKKLEDAGVRERRLNNALDKEHSETIKYMDELCNAKNEIERLTIDKRNDELRADVADWTVEKLKAENAELKQKLEDTKATAYAESVDAGMENRKLKRALWLARAERAKWQSLYYWYAISDKYKSRKFDEVERKCRAKAEQYQ